MNSKRIAWLALVCVLLANSSAFAEDSVSEALAAICKVESNGVGHASAVKAIKALNAASVSDVPRILQAMDQANSISENWLRGAIRSILAKGGELPRDAIQGYFDDSSHSSNGRLLAFELLTKGNQALADSMIPKMIDDPSLPLRYMAIKSLIEDAEAASDSDKVVAFGKLGLALEKARDVGQVQAIAKQLGELGVNVDLQKQLGFINTWQVVGCFDNKEMAGFDVAYGPEKNVGQVDFEATYKDLDGKMVTWKEVSTVDATGNVDLNELIGNVKGATVYAAGNFKAVEDGEVELRIGSANATKIWVNGELVMSNEIYHNSNSIDKFKGTAKLRKGDNQIMIKVCQNEQTQPWAQAWQFQLRVCDPTGKAIAPAKPPTPNY